MEPARSSDKDAGDARRDEAPPNDDRTGARERFGGRAGVTGYDDVSRGVSGVSLLIFLCHQQDSAERGANKAVEEDSGTVCTAL